MEESLDFWIKKYKQGKITQAQLIIIAVYLYLIFENKTTCFFVEKNIRDKINQGFSNNNINTKRDFADPLARNVANSTLNSFALSNGKKYFFKIDKNYFSLINQTLYVLNTEAFLFLEKNNFNKSYINELKNRIKGKFK